MSWIYRTQLGTRSNDVALLIWRVGLSATMIYGHGARKLMNYSAMAPRFRDPIGVGGEFTLILAIFAEVFCSILVMLGLFTRLALVPLMSTMAVAALIVHSADPFGRKELPLVYLLCYLALWLMGPGKLSLDHRLGKE